MPSRDQEQQIWRTERLRQPDGKRVGFEVIDRHQRQIVDQRNRLRGHQPHQ